MSFLLIFAFLAFAVLFFFLGSFFGKQKPTQEKTIRLEMETQVLKKQINSLESENKTLREKEKEFIRDQSKLQAECKNKKKELEYREKTLKEESEKLHLKFESMAQKILKESTKDYQNTSEKSFKDIVKPLESHILDFQKSIKKFEGTEESSKDSIKNLQDMYRDMRDETRKFTQALQGSAKTQGQWGEFILKNILEKSGLREGEEFIVQSKNLDLSNEEGQRLRPDVVVHLPDKKHIVIDSKVSLTHYQEYEQETDKKKREEYKNKIILSLTNHISALAQKDYCSLEGLKTPDFVLMFIPAEPIFSIAIQDKQALFEKAWEKSIVIVNPVTLIATLRTIASIWKIEKQNKNAEQIADESGKLYDKFVGFLDDMQKIEKGIKSASDSYDSAIKKLDSGRGNLIQKIENIKKLGAKTRKEIPAQFHQE